MSRPPSGEEHFSLEVDEGEVAWITFDAPGSRVNLLTGSVMEELDGLLGDLESRIATGGVVGAVFRSGKEGSFIAGADVEEIARIRDAADAREKSRQGQRIFRRLDRLPVPTVAAVDGACMGGGTELILACDFRLASGRDSTRIGLPETRLGILPGFGGTVRLPRVCGLQNAMEIILRGESVSAEKARSMGLVHRVAAVDGFGDEVTEFVADVLAGEVEREVRHPSVIDRLLEETALGRKLLFTVARRRTRKRTDGNYPAPLRALDVMEETYTLPLDQALEIEAEALGELAATPVSRNLVRLFLLSRDAKKALPEEERERARSVESLAVVGAGVMGASIAELAATKDLPVILKEIDRDALDSGLRHARELLEKAARKGVIEREEVGLAFSRIEGTLTYDGFEEVDLVIEAVVERMPIKRQVLDDVEERVPGEAVFATNTSSLSVSDLAGAARRPERVVGLHFFNPVHRMPLVEVVRAEGSADDAVATAFGFAVAMGKTPVLVADGPGFLVNRVLAPYLNEAGHLLADGVGIEAIDEALESFGMPMGPCRLLDEVGFDVASEVSGQLERAFGERMKPAAAVRRLLDEGRLGRKGGLGFYRYEDGEARDPDPAVGRILDAEPSRPADADSIRRRCLYPMVSEAGRALAEGIVAGPDDVDLAMVTGTGFPPFRGGLLRWADREGLRAIVEGLEELEDRHGPRFRPAERLREAAERDESFTDTVPV